MGRIGPACDGMVEKSRQSRIYCSVAAIWCAGRSVPGKPGGDSIQYHLGDKFLDWGWRVPFILSAILIVIGLWIRLGILETPVFSKLVVENKIEKAPALEVIKRQPTSIVLSSLIRLAEQTPFYIFTAFVFSYGTAFLKVDRSLLLNAVLLFAVLELFTIPLSGFISDRIGRKRTYLLGAGLMVVSGFIFFGLLDTRNPALIVLGIVFGAIPHSILYGTQASLIAEQFTPRLRYSGASIGYQLASIIAGGPAPLSLPGFSPCTRRAAQSRFTSAFVR